MNGSAKPEARPADELKALRARIAEFERTEAARQRTEAKLRQELAVNAALSALYEPLISPSSSIEDITNTVLDRARSLTGSAQGYVSSIDPVTGDNIGHTLTEMLKDQCKVAADKRAITFPRGRDGRYAALWGHSLNTHEAFYTNSPRTHPASSGIPDGHIRIRRFLSVPVMLGAELVGQIALANSRTNYTAEDLEAVQRLGELYALAIQRKRAEEALRQARDELEVRVQERTAELSEANVRLRGEITERERTQESLRRSNRALKARSQCSAALIHAKDETELLQEVCRILVEVAEYRLAWVGFAEQDAAQSVRPAAQAGFEHGYLQTLSITWADAERGRGPTGTAIRTGKPYCARYILTDPAFAPWRAEAAKRGYASSIALPLRSDGQTFGALNVYSGDPDAFDAEEIELLTSLANDLAYGVMVLRTRAERKRAEGALRESEERLQAILDNTTAVIYVKDTAGRFLLVNRRFEDVFHVTRAAVVGQTDHDLWPKEQADVFRANDQRVLQTRSPVEFEEAVSQHDGLHTYISLKFPLFDATGEPYSVCGISTDITERKRVAERLRRSERLASMGTFAAGIAHEVNNPLASILMTARHALNSGRDPRAINALLEEIIDDAGRCARIVKSVLQFAKQESSEKWALNLNNVTQRARDLSRDYARRRGVRLELQLSEDLPPVAGNRTELEQVFVNIINNAIDASRPGQGVVVRTEQVADKARVCVQDRGCGMTADEQEHAFDPFFTTRAKDGGTGLGLSMAHGTVTEHDGTISIDTGPGQGTTVIIELPLLLLSSEAGAP